MITRPRFAVQFVTDQQQALDFFVDDLGFEVLTDAPYGDDGRWVEVRPPGAETYLVLAHVDDEVHDLLSERLGAMGSVWFDCDDLDGTFADLSSGGVTFTVEPQPAPWDPDGTRWAQFADPDGTLYGLSEQTGQG